MIYNLILQYRIKYNKIELKSQTKCHKVIIKYDFLHKGEFMTEEKKRLTLLVDNDIFEIF